MSAPRLTVIVSGIAAAMVLGVGLVFLAQRGVFDQSLADTASPAPLSSSAIPDDRPARVMFLGTSLTYGAPWPQAVGEALSRCRPGGVVVQTLARPGAASPWGLEALGAALEVPPPDIVVVEFTANDASLARGVSVRHSRDIHQRIIALVRAAGALPVLVTMNPAIGRNGWERPGLRAYEALYRALAAESGAGLIDVARLWRAMPPEALARQMPDGLHPTPEAGLAVTAPAVTAALATALCADGAA
ncbi:MAG: hypothetical protein CO163_06830 [Rhodobacterales bacterium CG_4_9_14_3_um_filter_71_31]|nr:MAG: hypothetical protein CO163_06830 [Rhodobacterales bacterium CG_4_9_14_3_um_filter_71_31]